MKTQKTWRIGPSYFKNVLGAKTATNPKLIIQPPAPLRIDRFPGDLSGTHWRGKFTIPADPKKISRKMRVWLRLKVDAETLCVLLRV
jgi:hypothetical protein